MLHFIPARPLVELATVLVATIVAGLVALTVPCPTTLVIQVGASPAHPANRPAP